MTREHGLPCRCADCRHGRFNPGPPSKPRGHYGHLKVGVARKKFRVNQAHEAALREDAARSAA